MSLLDSHHALIALYTGHCAQTRVVNNGNCGCPPGTCKMEGKFGYAEALAWKRPEPPTPGPVPIHYFPKKT